MHLTQNNDVVHTLTPDRSDQPFHKAILPRRGRCGRPAPDAHGAQSACNDAAIDAIPIADEVSWSLIPWKCLRYLTLLHAKPKRQLQGWDEYREISAKAQPPVSARANAANTAL